MKKSTSGFTIVELLIVIVVIAILAVISVVAYSGIQNRTYDVAVQSDLSSLAKKYELFRAESSTSLYPTAVSDLTSLDMKVSKSVYLTTGTTYNLTPCLADAGTHYAVVAISKSGKRLYVKDGQGISEYTGATSWTNGAYDATCASVLSGATAMPGASSGFASGVWRQWVGN